MAASFRGRKNLVCFYCNKRSGTRYDGLITQWDCTQCESTNFLDENGEITDPPVATDFAAPGIVQYGIPRPGPLSSSQESEAPLFCSKCLKNQHLFTASLAQYDVELDTRDPNFKQKEKDYYAFRRRMEKNYPQVCKDCEPRVLGRMKEAGMTAKADHLRRLMDKTRARRSQKQRNFSASGGIEMGGKIFWYLGLVGQLSWSVSVLVASIFHASPEHLQPFPASALSWLEIFASISISNSWARNSLFCSIVSVWWNPMFNAMNKGFVNHITGFGEWYKLQTLMIMSRFIFYFISGTGVLADPFSPPTVGAHIVMLVYITFLANKAKRSLKVDMAPLWQSTPERLVNVGPRSNSPARGTDSLADILDSIAASPTTGHRELASPSPSPSPQKRNQRRSAPYDTPVRSVYRGSTPVGTNAGFGLDLSKSDFSHGLATGQNPVSHGPPIQYSSTEDEMDWTPAHPVESEHRAFKPITSFERNSKVFGHSPVEEKSSTFWYKVPPAPTTPAQRLRNPPNQPRFQPPSREVKENFFNNVAQRHSNDELQPNLQRGGTQRHEMNLRQPKFFPPAPASEVGNNLSDLLTSFSLGSSDSESPVAIKDQFRWDHFGHAVVLALGLFFWNQAFSNPGDHSIKVMLAVMTGCMAIAARTVIVHLLIEPGKETNVARVIGTALGGLECGSALYGISEILAGRGQCVNCASWGTILVGGMLVQEFWYAASFAP